VIVLCDDLGFSDIGSYGSEIPTPELDALAANGIRYRNFHAAPICSPTRASLLTGMNPHRAGFGRVASFDPGFPGYSMEFPAAAPTIASELRGAGYATFAVGKWHLAREIEQSAAGSRHGWPLQRGFDRFYGFLDGFTNFFHPHQLVSDNHHLSIAEYPQDYYLTDDLTEVACGMIRELRAADSDKPFFLYLAHGAVHAPLQAPDADIAPFVGAYDDGWDLLRTQRFRRQIELGLFPADSVLPDVGLDADFGFPRWAELTGDQRRLASRYMEVYAAMVSTVDRSLGALRRTLEALDEWDDTIVMFMSDNGASSDLGPAGTTRYMLGHGSAIPENVDLDMANLAAIGGPRVFAHYPRGWALACNTPFRLYKRNTHAGGHTVPFIVHWPNGRLPAGEIREGYAHVVDLLPTILELSDAGTEIGSGLDGVSFAASMKDPDAGLPRREQVYEAHGNRGLYRDGWEIVAEHQPLQPFSEQEWELYRVESDVTESNDLSARHPELVRELSIRWDELAASGDVFPLEDGSGVFFHQRPAFHRPEENATFWPGLPTIERIRARDLVWNRSFTIDARLGEADGHRGVIVAHGDQASGYQLHVDGGELCFLVNAAGVMTEIACGSITRDDVVIIVEISSPVLDRWDVAVMVDGQSRASRDGIWMRTGLMTPLHGIDIGLCRGSPVSWSIYERHGSFPWTGGIHSVRYRPGAFASDAPQLRVDEYRAIGLAVPGSARDIPGHD
jgi:arylsulfatase